jgi:RND family efflux transporter MFP subunit
MEALVALPEAWLGEARSSHGSVKLWAGPERRYEARLRELSPQADAMTRTYAARFTIENPDDQVALGMTATVTLSHATDGSLVKLPLAAILNRGKGPSVYVVDTSGELELRPVTVASFTAAAAVVTAGVSDGERVVTLGVQKLDAGQKVRAVDQP